jgi:hypothetical protein
MTTAESNTTATGEKRGAGTGENAVAQRSRHSKDDPAQANDLNKIVQEAQAKAAKNNQKFASDTEAELDRTAAELPEPGEVTEYPEGDPDKGALEPETARTQNLIPMRDRRAYLLLQAQRNQDANDQLNAIQVAQNRRVAELPSLLQDPDYLRETSMETAQAALMTHDPGNVRKNREQALELQKRRRLAASKDEDSKKTTAAAK